MSRVVIRPHADGLGDALIYSTLPELYANMGHQVFISGGCRNEQVRNLVWGCNPYVSGFCDDPPTTKIGLKFIREAYRHRSVIEAMESLHCFQPANLFPKIYYKPKFLERWRHVVVGDPRSISQPIDAKSFDASVAHAASRLDFHPSSVTVLTSTHAGPHGVDSLRDNQRYQVLSFEEYADIIHSCALFLVAESGGQVLSSAICALNGRWNVIATFTTAASNDHTFTFPNIRYNTVGGMTPDFWGI